MSTAYTPSPHLEDAIEFAEKAAALDDVTNSAECATAFALISIAQSLEKLTATAEATTEPRPQRDANDGQAKILLARLDRLARDFESYEYGLPLHDDLSRAAMLNIVRNWLAEVRS